MSLFASLDVANPIASQSGALIAPVKTVDLGCNTGTSTHLQNTIVQTGLGRKSKNSKTKRARKNKPASKSGKRKYKRTMNRRRKRSRMSRMSRSGKTKTKSSRKSTRKNRRVRVNQVGRGSSYTNVLTPMDGMGRHAARSDVALVQTGPVAAPTVV
jgi:hypothetical protein